MNYIYCYRNKKIAAWNTPIFSPIPPDGMGETVRRACLEQSDEARKSHLDECDFFLLGTFDDIKGTISVLEEPEFIISCDQFFVAKKEEEDKFSKKIAKEVFGYFLQLKAQEEKKNG